MREVKDGQSKFFEVRSGEMVLREGDVSDDMFKILRGNAELYLNHGTKNEVLLGILGANACFGEFGLLLHRPSPYTVIAYSDMVVYRVSDDKVHEFIRENHSSVLLMMKSMANTMIIMQNQITQLYNEIGERNEVNEKISVRNKNLLKTYIGGMRG